MWGGVEEHDDGRPPVPLCLGRVHPRGHLIFSWEGGREEGGREGGREGREGGGEEGREGGERGEGAVSVVHTAPGQGRK